MSLAIQVHTGMYSVHTRDILVCTDYTTCTIVGTQAAFVCLSTTIYIFNTPSFICHSPTSSVCLLSTFQQHSVQTSTYWYELIQYKYIHIMIQFILHSNHLLARSPLRPARVSFLSNRPQCSTNQVHTCIYWFVTKTYHALHLHALAGRPSLASAYLHHSVLHEILSNRPQCSTNQVHTCIYWFVTKTY
jgi:hypothetical protein